VAHGGGTKQLAISPGTGVLASQDVTGLIPTSLPLVAG